MEGLDFLKPMGDQQRKIIAQNDEVIDLIKQYLKKPLPAPVIEIDYEQLAKHVTALMGDPAGLINQASTKLDNKLNGFIKSAESVPSSVPIRGQFYGFTGWKPFLLHYLIIILSVGFGAYSWFYNSDDETIRRLTKNRDVLDGRIESLKDKNLITASIYFPEYLSLAEKAEAAWRKKKK